MPGYTYRQLARRVRRHIPVRRVRLRRITAPQWRTCLGNVMSGSCFTDEITESFRKIRYSVMFFLDSGNFKFGMCIFHNPIGRINGQNKISQQALTQIYSRNLARSPSRRKHHPLAESDLRFMSSSDNATPGHPMRLSSSWSAASFRPEIKVLRSLLQIRRCNRAHDIAMYVYIKTLSGFEGTFNLLFSQIT